MDTNKFQNPKTLNKCLISGGGGPPAGWYNPYSAPIPSPGMKYIELYNIEIDPSETSVFFLLFPVLPFLEVNYRHRFRLYASKKILSKFKVKLKRPI